MLQAPSDQFFTQDGCVLFHRITCREFVLRIAIGNDLVSNAVIQSQNAFVVQIINPHEHSPLRDYLLLDFSPISTSRRMATERPGLSSCAAAQASIMATISSDQRVPICRPRPVAGRPRRFLVPFFLALFIEIWYQKIEPDGSCNFQAGSNLNHRKG